MARKVREKSLDTREARNKLKPRGKPYYRQIGQGLHLGYRKGRGTRRWVARMYLGDGKYTVESIGYADDIDDADGVKVLTYWQAQDAARDLLAKRTSADGPPRGPLTVRRAIDDYLEHIQDKPSYYEVKRRLAAYVPPALAEKDVATLTRKELVAWHRSCAKTAPRARTKAGADQRHRQVDMHDEETVRKRRSSANRILGMLKAALNHSVKDANAPWHSVKPFEGVDAARRRYLSFAECTRLLNACDPDLRKLVHALLLTGARYQEIARLRVEDYNPDAGTIHIRKSKAGKERHVVLTDQGIEFFEQLTAGRSPGDLMMGREWGKSQQDKRMRAACERAGIVPHVGVHVMRHTYISQSLMAGVPKEVIAMNVGHTSTRMIEKHYGHLAPNYVTEMIRQRTPRFGVVETSSIVRMKTKTHLDAG